MVVFSQVAKREAAVPLEATVSCKAPLDEEEPSVKVDGRGRELLAT